MAELAPLAGRACAAQAGGQTLALFQLFLPDGAGRTHRPGRGAGTAAADRPKPGPGRLGGAPAPHTHGVAHGLLAGDGPAQRTAAWSADVLRWSTGSRGPR